MSSEKAADNFEDLDRATYQNLEEKVQWEDNLSQEEIDELMTRLQNGPW